MQHRHTTPDRLGDRALIAALRDAIAAVQVRPPLRAELKHLLAETLAEMRMEQIAGSSLAPEAIVDIARGTVTALRA